MNRTPNPAKTDQPDQPRPHVMAAGYTANPDGPTTVAEHLTHTGTRLLAATLLAAAAGIDVLLITPAMTIITGSTGPLGTATGAVTAAGLAILAMLLMLEAGHDAHNAHVLARRPITAATLGIVFLTIGIGITWIRWHAGDLTDTTITTEGASSITAAGSSDPNQLHHLMALCLLPIYLGTGALAFTTGWNLPTALVKRYRTALARLRTAGARLADLEGLVLRRHLAVENTRRELGRIETQRQLHQIAITALADQGKTHARGRVALALADPSATDILNPAQDHTANTGANGGQPTPPATSPTGTATGPTR